MPKYSIAGCCATGATGPPAGWAITTSCTARSVALCFALAPERVVLGTIPTAAGEELCLQPLRSLVAEQLWPEFARELQILPSALGDELPFYAGVGVALEGEGGADR